MGNLRGARLLAFDIGGTRLKAGTVAFHDDAINGARVEDIAGYAVDDVLAAVAKIGHEMLSETPCRGVGLCAPGLIDAAGKWISLPGKIEGAAGHDLARWLTEEFTLPSVVVNDAIAHGVGEACAGAGRNRERVVVMTIGTGVGVSVVQEGAPLTIGTLGGGTMGGHIPISDRDDGYLDSNGRPDTIEALCCARRIVDYANEFGEPASSVPDVYNAYARGSDAARRGINRYQNHLARGLVALAHAHAPDLIVIGGGAMTPDNPVMDGLESLVNERLFGPYSIEIMVARLGELAALHGLTHIFKQRYRSE